MEQVSTQTKRQQENIAKDDRVRNTQREKRKRKLKADAHGRKTNAHIGDKVSWKQWCSLDKASKHIRPEGNEGTHERSS